MGKHENTYVRAGGKEIRYVSAGNKGKALILIHGFGTSLEIWQHNIDVLSKDLAVYALDIPGFGHSDKSPVPDFFSSMPDILHDFMGQLGVQKASFMGVSLGGALSILFALKYPQNAERLVLVDSGGLGTELPFVNNLASLPVLGEFLTKPSKKGTFMFLKSLVHDPAVLTDDMLDFYYQLSSLPGAQEALLRVLRSFCSVRGTRRKLLDSIMGRVGEIKAPTQIIWGRHDQSFPVSHAEFAHRMIKGSKLHIFEDCGHLPNFEDPEGFNRVVLEFFQDGN